MEPGEPTIQRMVDFVIDDHSLNGGQHSADGEERFAQRFAGELTPGQIRQLVAWYFSNDGSA